MRTSRLAGAPIALAGIAFLVVAYNLTLALNAPQSANLPDAGIQIGNARIDVPTAVFLEVLLFIVGIATIALGIIVRFFGRPPGA